MASERRETNERSPMISQGFFLMAISGLWYREGESIAEHSGHLEWKKYRLELEED